MKTMRNVLNMYVARLKLQAPSHERIRNHLNAFTHPTASERPIVGMFKCLADYADQYEAKHSTKLAGSVLGVEWLSVLNDVRALLHNDIGRLSVTLLDQLGNEMAEAAGFRL